MTQINATVGEMQHVVTIRCTPRDLHELARLAAGDVVGVRTHKDFATIGVRDTVVKFVLDVDRAIAERTR